MDLIDIDKVLDDLELDENGKIEESETKESDKIKNQKFNDIVNVELVSGDNKSETFKTASNDTTTNDYTNENAANVVQLKVDYDDDRGTDEDKEKEGGGAVPHADGDDSAGAGDALEFDIHCGAGTSDFEREDEATTSASSITTSSPSSFSSGLSPMSSNDTSPQIHSGSKSIASDKLKLMDYIGEENVSESLSAMPNLSESIDDFVGHNEALKTNLPAIDCNESVIVKEKSEEVAKQEEVEDEKTDIAGNEVKEATEDMKIEEEPSKEIEHGVSEQVEISTENDHENDYSKISDIDSSECPSTMSLEDHKPTEDKVLTESEPTKATSVVEDISSSDFSIETAAESKEEPQTTQTSQTEENATSVNVTSRPEVERPATLDLPCINVPQTTLSNAGQTPPASYSSQHSTDQPSQSLDSLENSSTPAGSSASHHRSTLNSSELGKVAPFWIPDSQAPACMQCKQKFSIIKRRHHCRACGKVLCAVCCSQKGKLDFLGSAEARICNECHHILTTNAAISETASRDNTLGVGGSRQPNPNNPKEYCSVIPPPHQAGAVNQEPMSVVVPVGVLKREGTAKSVKKDKNVIFSDGIRPGYDLTELDQSWNAKTSTAPSANPYDGSEWSRMSASGRCTTGAGSEKESRNKAPVISESNTFIPNEPDALPPIYVSGKSESQYVEVKNGINLINRLQNETLKFAIQKNFYVYVRIRKLKCCVNVTVINFTTCGMCHVGQDEIVILLELDKSDLIPKDIFTHLNEIYCSADSGCPISELGFSIAKSPEFLSSREHGGFLYIRPTFQCLQEICVPEPPFLIGVLIHRWEVPWAKIFPLRLMLRLGAQYRYYPSPHVSFRGRDSVYAEIAQTIINFLADFRNFSFTIATIRGMYIHMEDRKTTMLIPRNRHEHVVKALNNSTDYILALGASFSKKADGHLVCMQNMNSDCPDSYTYSTQSINIQGQPRKITGASFLVLNGALKTTSGLLGKCSIVEDGIMVQILPTKMVAVQKALKDMKDIEIACGPVEGDAKHKEIVAIQWTENDVEFNVGVKSPIDNKKMDGIPSIRVNSRMNYSNANHTIRWTEVFIIQTNQQIDEDTNGKNSSGVLKLCEQIAKSTSVALIPFLDLLVANGSKKIGLRTIIYPDNVCYEAGSQNAKLTPLYMNALDNELIPLLHKQATYWDVDKPLILELIFYILDK